jgi:hypothetical protein
MKIKLGEFRKLVKEALDESMLAPHPTIELAIEKMVDTWIEDQKASFDPSDPTMARSGEKEWHVQVAMAGRELEERMLEVADEVMDRLHGGEFYHGTPKVTSPKIPF